MPAVQGTPSASYAWARQQVGGSQPVGTAEAVAGLGGGGGGLIGGYTPQQFLLLPSGTQQAIANIYGTDAVALINWAQIKEDAKQFNISNKQDYDLAMKSYENAVRVAQIYASSGSAQAQAQVQAAQIDAQAAIDAANIAAQASRYSDDTKAQIAREANALEEKRVAAIEFARPSDWAARIGYMRGQTPEQAAALTKYAGGTVFGGQMPGGAALPQLQPATAGATPAAIVGEPGPQGQAQPELATALPGGGVQITPLQEQQARWLRGRLPEMARGGAISGGYGGAGGGSLRAAQETSRSVRPGGGLQPWATMQDPWFERGVEQQRGFREFGLALADPRTLDLAIEARKQMGVQRDPFATPRVAGGGAMQAGVQYTPGAGGVLHPWGAAAGQGAALPAAGGTPAGGALPASTGGTTTPAGETSPIDQLPFLVAGRAGGQYNVAPFQAWTGERTFPAMGINEPIPTPWEFNLNQWNNLARAEQAMWAGLWRKALMIPGETEEEMLANAREAIGRSAFTGMGSALPQYGAW